MSNGIAINGDFLKELGGSAVHQDILKKHGLAYIDYIEKFDRVIASLPGVKNDELLPEVLRIVDNTKDADYENELVKWLVEKSRVKKGIIRSRIGKVLRS